MGAIDKCIQSTVEFLCRLFKTTKKQRLGLYFFRNKLTWDGGGSIIFNALKMYAPLAQLVEQLTLNQWVQGSSP